MSAFPLGTHPILKNMYKCDLTMWQSPLGLNDIAM